MPNHLPQHTRAGAASLVWIAAALCLTLGCAEDPPSGTASDDTNAATRDAGDRDADNASDASGSGGGSDASANDSGTDTRDVADDASSDATAPPDGGPEDAPSSEDAAPTEDASDPDDAPDGADAGDGLPNCKERARWIYVIDRERRLAQFQPDTLEFVDIGTLDCDAGSETPLSMSVDQDATAWVLYGNGRVYRVSTLDASCSPGPIAPGDGGFTHFGMAFSRDLNDPQREDLYVAGGDIIDLMEEQPPTLARLDTSTGAVAPFGALDDWAELSGTRNGELFAFIPSEERFTTIYPARVLELDTNNGAVLTEHTLDAMGTGDGRAWAFAAWGGAFYIFFQEDGAPSSSVWRFNPDDNTVERVLTHVGRGITGAGVSICAPR